MISALVVICCCYISGATGRFVPENTTKIRSNNAAYLQEEELLTDINNNINKNISTLNPENILKITNYGNKNSLESLNHKINESELYENAQALKENNERSFVLKNQKFKSQWFGAKRLGLQSLQGNLFDSDNRNNFELPSIGSSYNQNNNGNVPRGHSSLDRKTSQNAYGYKPMVPYYKPYKKPSISKTSGKEYLELLKKPMLRPSPNKMDISGGTVNTNQDLFSIDNDDRKNEINFFDDDQDSVLPKLAAMQNDQESDGDCSIKGQQILQYTTLKPRSIMDNFIPTGSESEAKLNQYLSDALRQQLIESEVIKKHYNCYNSSCEGKQNKHQNSMYNGVIQGVHCLCNQASTPSRPMQQEAPAPARPMTQGVSAQGKLMRQEAAVRGGLMLHEGRGPSRHMRKEVPGRSRLMLQEAPSRGMLMMHENVPQDRHMHQHPRLPGRLMRQDNEVMSTKTTTEDFDLDKLIRETEKLCQLSDTITK